MANTPDVIAGGDQYLRYPTPEYDVLEQFTPE